MAHQTETIVAAVVTILKNAATAAGSRVYRGRTLPVEAIEGSMINVYEGDEAVSLSDVNWLKHRELELNVEMHTRALPTDQNDPGSIDTAMNEFLRQVEVAIEADFRLAGTCLMFTHTGTRRERADAERELRVVTLIMRVEYRTQRTNPEIQL